MSTPRLRSRHVTRTQLKRGHSGSDTRFCDSASIWRDAGSDTRFCGYDSIFRPVAVAVALASRAQNRDAHALNFARLTRGQNAFYSHSTEGLRSAGSNGYNEHSVPTRLGVDKASSHTQTRQGLTYWRRPCIDVQY